MGYHMKQTNSIFEIKSGDKDKALEAVKELASSSPGFPSENYSWVDNIIFKNAESLKDAMSEWRWEIIEYGNGDMIGISFSGEKIGDDEILFNAIAPFVKEGSYIQMSGEEGDMWRWLFNGEECIEINPTIIWEE